MNEKSDLCRLVESLLVGTRSGKLKWKMPGTKAGHCTLDLKAGAVTITPRGCRLEGDASFEELTLTLGSGTTAVEVRLEPRLHGHVAQILEELYLLVSERVHETTCKTFLTEVLSKI